MRRAWLLAVLVVSLAGCAKEPQAVPGPPAIDPMGEPFADARHCVGYNLRTSVAATDLMPLVPDGWSFANPLAPTVRLLVTRCPDQAVAFLSVPMRAGGADAPEVEYLLQVFAEGRDNEDAPDDWSRLGLPAEPATVTVGDRLESLAIETPRGWAVQAALDHQPDPGRQYERAMLYGASDPVVRTWAEESAILTTPMGVPSIAFGPGSALRDAKVVPLNSGTWWGAYNAWYRDGWPE